MGMLMPLIILLAKFCIIGFALFVHGSSGLNASPSPAKSSIFPPIEGNPGAVEQRSDAPRTVSEPNGSGFNSLAVPLLVSALVPETNSLLPSNSVELPSYNMAPPPITMEVHIPSSAPSSTVVLPPSQYTAPPLFTIERHVPSTAPSSTVVLPPPHDMSPPPFTSEGHVPSLAPSSTAVLPTPHDMTPPPFNIEGHVPSIAPSSPVVLPTPHDTVLPPFTVEGRVPSFAPSSTVASPPPSNTVSPTPPIQVHSPLKSPAASQAKKLIAPAASPSRNLPQISPAIDPFQPITPSQNPPESSPADHSTPVTPPLRNSPQISPAIHSSSPSAFIPSSSQRNSSNNKAHVLEPTAPAPAQPQLGTSPQNPPATPSSNPNAQPPTANQGNSSNGRAPIMEPVAPAPVATPSRNPPTIQKEIHARVPNASPPSASIPKPNAPVATPLRKSARTPPCVHSIMPPSILPVPVVSPSAESPQNLPIINPNVIEGTPSRLPDPDLSPVSSPPLSSSWKNNGIPVLSPKNEIHKPVPAVSVAPEKGPSSAITPAPVHHKYSPVPSPVSSNNNNPPALSPTILFHKHKHRRHVRTTPAPATSYLFSPPPMKQQGPVVSPEFPPGRRQRHYAPPPLNSISSPRSDIPLSVATVSPVPSPSTVTASRHTKKPLITPTGSPSVSPLRSPKVPPPPLVMSFPPPPPNTDCSTTICTEPYTNTPPGSPCGCVLPMQVGLRLSVALYTFFPLVSELAAEIASGVFVEQSQVRIMGANAASEQPEKTLVMLDLVPLGEKFDNTTAFLTSDRFWHKQVPIKASLFGDYEVLYVRYLGLPPSPPLPPSDFGIIDAGPYPGNDNNARAVKPLGVDVHGKQHRSVLNGGMIAIIVLSALVALVLCSSIAWVLLFKHRSQGSHNGTTPQPLQTSLAKPSGSAGSMVGSGLSSTSVSLSSSIAAYTGTAKTFTASDIEKATANFDSSRILGEGGFGRVFSGVLHDDTKVAVKVLKRDDQQGGREFLAEVEMLSRLHHRNLVKLIGICTEEQMRCLVYELIPNGSVESHLHGIDKESSPLDWDARIKIALGAARGLAYLHEDSSPHVIHRDFKSSNILLEHDFTPKVSDFGLARTAMDESGRHISTRVMGTFGYVAPEYAMTGHLLVKSDVYSYGVVLLELLTGRKPVDMTQPPGQENLVAWARPLLTTKEGLETITDPSLGSDIPFDSVAKVAAIASMCVEPEVSHRPFMGEVVQALKLVCNECDEAKEAGSRGSGHDNLSIDLDDRASAGSGRLTDPSQSHYFIPNYDSNHDTERGISASDLFSSSARLGRQSSGSFRRHFSSGPLTAENSSRFLQKMRRLSRGSISEHGFMIKF